MIEQKSRLLIGKHKLRYSLKLVHSIMPFHIDTAITLQADDTGSQTIGMRQVKPYIRQTGGHAEQRLTMLATGKLPLQRGPVYIF